MIFLVSVKKEPENPCTSSPCGPNSECHVINNAASCSCVPDFQGTPPYCRPECILDAECSLNQICYRSKCKDPCPGLCGVNAICQTRNHVSSCICSDSYTGNPYNFCERIPLKIEHPPVLISNDECDSCGVNAYCRRNVCECLEGLYGNPKTICRPECVSNSECSQDKACINNKCSNPCVGVCGRNAICEVRNHFAICSCPQNMIGDALTKCVTPESKYNFSKS